MFRIVICYHQPQDMESLLSTLDKITKNCLAIDIATFCFDSEDKLLQNMESGQEYDLYILDTLMPAGIELAEKIRSMDASVPLIFLSSSTEYAFDAFRVCATQYFLKPTHEAELLPVLNKILAAGKRKKNKTFLFTASGRTVPITFSEIIYVELYGRTMTAHLENGDTLQSNTIRTSFTEAIAPLLADDRFLQTHKSFVLNMDHVREMTGNSFIMTDDSEILVPKYKFAAAKAKFLSWLSYRGIGIVGVQKDKSAVKRSLVISVMMLFILTAIINLSPALYAAASEIPIIGDMIKILTFNRFEHKEGSHEAEILVPEIHGLLDPALQDRLNTEFRENADQLIHSFEETILALDETGDETAHMSIMADYTVKRDDHKVLSIDTYLYSNVSGFTCHKFYTIDKRTGAFVTLAGLFMQDADYITPLSAYIAEEMLRLNRDEGGLFSVGDSLFESFTEIRPDHNFYINRDGMLVICFDKYEVAAGVQGSPEFEIPIDIIQDILSSDLIG